LGIDAHKGVRGIKVDPPSKMFTKLVNKNAIKPKRGVPSPKKFAQPHIPSPQIFGKNLMDPPPVFSNSIYLFWLNNEVK
jgi:hypothetical protein